MISLGFLDTRFRGYDIKRVFQHPAKSLSSETTQQIVSAGVSHAQSLADKDRALGVQL